MTSLQQISMFCFKFQIPIYLVHNFVLFSFVFFFGPELMLLGFISLLLTVFQGLISHICIPAHVASYMLPCKLETSASSGSETNHELFFHQTMTNGRRLLSTNISSGHCTRKVSSYDLFKPSIFTSQEMVQLIVFSHLLITYNIYSFISRPQLLV